MRDPGNLDETVSGVRDGDLVDLLARVEAATGPIELGFTKQGDDDLLAVGHLLGCVHGGDYSVVYDAFRGSLDAALALVERQKGSGIDAAQLLHEALEDLANGGWRDDQPIGPQAARRLLAAMLRSMIDE